MLLGNPIEFTHVPLRLVPKILNAVDVIPLIGKELGVVDPEVLEVRHIQHIVGLPAVGIYNAVGNDFPLDDRYQRIGPGIWNDLRVDPASTLQQPENRDFSPSTTAPLPLSPSAEIGLVHFDLAANNQVGLLLEVISDDLSKSMKIIGRRFAVHTDKGRRATGRRARHKMLNQTILLSLA